MPLCCSQHGRDDARLDREPAHQHDDPSPPLLPHTLALRHREWRRVRRPVEPPKLMSLGVGVVGHRFLTVHGAATTDADRRQRGA
jgi:hypothetical protein